MRNGPVAGGWERREATSPVRSDPDRRRRQEQSRQEGKVKKEKSVAGQRKEKKENRTVRERADSCSFLVLSHSICMPFVVVQVEKLLPLAASIRRAKDPFSLHYTHGDEGNLQVVPFS